MMLTMFALHLALLAPLALLVLTVAVCATLAARVAMPATERSSDR